MAEARAPPAAVSSSQYDLPQQPHESDSATAADIKSWVREILDWLVKLLPVIATILVAVLADQYKASLTASTLLSEREKADSQLRSEMFSKLVDPISGAKSGSEVPIEREQLLAELLSLNFHEHIGLRPLLNHVDGRLARESLDPDKAERLTRARQSFRTVARSVISRQTAMLTRTNGDGTTADGAHIQRLDIGATIVGQQLFKGAKGDGVLVGVLDEPIEIMSPSGAQKLYLLLERPNWENETFHADVSIFAVKKDGAKESETELAHHEFELSWFDFPLTENTLLADGTRFAIVLDQVYDTTGRSDTPSNQLTIESIRRAKINVIWFPKDYIAARERPTNYREFRRSLGLDER